MKHILVTGGAGFIGSHLCERLLAEGHRVTCMDNFYTGTRQNIAPLMANPAFRLVEHDVIEPWFCDEKIDQIYNLACPASPIYYQIDPIKTIKTAVLGAMHMLGLAKQYDASILQASTSEVYGDPVVHPQNENYWGNVNPIGPRSCYDEGKRCAESLFASYHMQHGMSTKIIRIFNTYGPKMNLDDGRVVSNFIVQALSGEPLTIYGDGTQTRSFQYIDDLIEGMLRTMASEDEFTGPVNLGNPVEYTMYELAQEVISLTGSTSTVLYEQLPEDDPRQRRPDISLARRTLDWAPKVPLRDGLIKTIDYFRHLMKDYSGGGNNAATR